MTRRIWVDPWRKHTRRREYEQFVDSEIPYKVDFAASATDRGTSVSSVAWSSEGTQLVSITNESLASGVASADVSAGESGFGLVKVVATFADGNDESVYFDIRVRDPETR